jgi:hypothetical protein
MEIKAHVRDAVKRGSKGMIASHVITGDMTPPVIDALNKIKLIKVVWYTALAQGTPPPYRQMPIDTLTIAAAAMQVWALRRLPIQYNHAAIQSKPMSVQTEKDTKKIFRVLRKCNGSLRLMKI